MKTPLVPFVLLCMAFMAYTISIYQRPLRQPVPASEAGRIAQGRLVWQKYNCQSCHQLFGLGGYLGPDLTNLLSVPGKDANYLKAFVRSGIRQMPAFDIPEEELELLVDFLRAADRSGKASPANFRIKSDGMIESHE